MKEIIKPITANKRLFGKVLEINIDRLAKPGPTATYASTPINPNEAPPIKLPIITPYSTRLCKIVTP